MTAAREPTATSGGSVICSSVTAATIKGLRRTIGSVIEPWLAGRKSLWDPGREKTVIVVQGMPLKL
jgi:hypothetical protein